MGIDLDLRYYNVEGTSFTTAIVSFLFKLYHHYINRKIFKYSLKLKWVISL